MHMCSPCGLSKTSATITGNRLTPASCIFQSISSSSEHYKSLCFPCHLCIATALLQLALYSVFFFFNLVGEKQLKSNCNFKADITIGYCNSVRGGGLITLLIVCAFTKSVKFANILREVVILYPTMATQKVKTGHTVNIKKDNKKPLFRLCFLVLLEHTHALDFSHQVLLSFTFSCSFLQIFPI